MSKLECNKAYYNHKIAMEAAKKVPKVSKVAEIFRCKPYSSTNYTAPEETEHATAIGIALMQKGKPSDNNNMGSIKRTR